MKVQIYVKKTEHHKHWCGAFADGLAKHGIHYDITSEINTPSVADVFVFWSMRHIRLIEYCKEHGVPFICLERGYIDRMNFASVNLNGLNGRSQLDLTDFEHNQSRISKHKWYINPRETKGRELIVIGQVPGDKSLEGQDPHKWALSALQHFEAHGYAPMFKPHPLDPNICNKLEGVYNQTFYGYKVFQGDMQDAIEQAETFVTFSSNAGVDAWLNGVPAIAESPISMLYKWQTIEGHCEGVRRWLCDLSFRQYNAEEMKKGEAWQIIRHKLLPPS